MNIDYYDRRKEEWSTSETEQLRIEYWYKQLTILQIAYIHRRTPGDILYKLKMLHIISEYKYARGYFDYINSNLYIQIMEKIHNEKKKRVEQRVGQNVGKPWTSEEDSQLISEYKSKNITEICKIHKRNIGGIKSRLRKLNCKKESNQLQDFNEMKQDIKELKETVKELTVMLKARV